LKAVPLEAGGGRQPTSGLQLDKGGLRRGVLGVEELVDAVGVADLGFGRSVASEIEVPIMLGKLV
jgi:hypothetical protein